MLTKENMSIENIPRVCVVVRDYPSNSSVVFFRNNWIYIEKVNAVYKIVERDKTHIARGITKSFFTLSNYIVSNYSDSLTRKHTLSRKYVLCKYNNSYINFTLKLAKISQI